MSKSCESALGVIGRAYALVVPNCLRELDIHHRSHALLPGFAYFDIIRLA